MLQRCQNVTNPSCGIYCNIFMIVQEKRQDFIHPTRMHVFGCPTSQSACHFIPRWQWETLMAAINRSGFFFSWEFNLAKLKSLIGYFIYVVVSVCKLMYSLSVMQTFHFVVCPFFPPRHIFRWAALSCRFWLRLQMAAQLCSVTVTLCVLAAPAAAGPRTRHKLAWFVVRKNFQQMWDEMKSKDQTSGPQEEEVNRINELISQQGRHAS